MNDNVIKASLLIALNQCKCDFGETTFTKAHLLRLAEGKEAILRDALDEWSYKGAIRWIRPWEKARPEETMVELLDYIERGGPHK